jgi:subtilisin family serine protease
MDTTTLLPRKPRAHMGLALLPMLLGLGVCLAWALAANVTPRAIHPETAAHSGECATPDSVVLEPLAYPSREREKHLAALGVDDWHRHGVHGKSIKIAVLDSGFRGYKAFLGKALPETVTVRSFRSDGNLEARDSQHGILCAEVLHALAPDAELLFANWDPERPDEFLAAVKWAKHEGARILSCSLIMPSWSDGEGGGPLHEELSGLLGSGDGQDDLLLFASAGNTAQRHWGGAFHDAGDGSHQWADGVRANPLTPWSQERVSVELCWSGPADYQLVVRDRAGDEAGHACAVHAGEQGRAIVRFDPEALHRYEVLVRLQKGKPAPFHLVVLGGSLQYARARGSVSFPADGPEVIAVGAVDAKGERLDYSSCGPNSAHTKPDLVAPVPFPSLWRATPFSGTSAAAPQASGLAALLWSKHPEWTAKRVREELIRDCRDLGPPGPDDETGYGLIALPAPER